MRADLDRRAIEKNAVHVRVEALAHGDVEAVVAVKGRLDDRVVGEAAEQRRQRLPVAGRVEPGSVG